jgi:glycosyltransferase involved in cell wall biosynthesis
MITRLGDQEKDMRPDLSKADRMRGEPLSEFRASSSATPTLVPERAARVGRIRSLALPTVSAVIPVFNGKLNLAEAVSSVAAQTVRPCELIVVDDGSSDDSTSVIDERLFEFPVRIVRQPNGGQSSARNRGARLAHGDLVALLDQDDRWYPHHLERLIEPFIDRPELGFTYSNIDEIDGDGKVVCLGRLQWSGAAHPKQSLSELLAGDMFILPSASLIRREAFLAIGGFDEQFSGYEDDDLFIRLFRAGFQHTYINESLSQWRIHERSTSYGTNRMDVSRRRFAEKLMAMCPNDPCVDHWWVRDHIAPRFFRRAVHQFHTAALRLDWAACYEAQQEAQHFAEKMVCGPRLRMRLALMRHPGAYRFLYQWWKRDPALLRGPKKDAKPEEIMHPRV